jgi:arabinose-5-phosphate isomerase
MLALGDAVAFTLSERRGLTAEQFARNHPAGSLGRKLASVEAYMRKGPALRVASAGDTVREVFASAGRRGRRTGAILLLDAKGRLCGIYTDSDLARLFERRADENVDRPIREVMTRNPRTVRAGTKMGQALDILKEHKISELPVVDAAGRPVGVLDITDVLDLLPATETDPADAGDPPLRLRRGA